VPTVGRVFHSILVNVISLSLSLSLVGPFFSLVAESIFGLHKVRLRAKYSAWWKTLVTTIAVPSTFLPYIKFAVESCNRAVHLFNDDRLCVMCHLASHNSRIPARYNTAEVILQQGLPVKGRRASNLF
jgi:hypothetical protein